MTDYLHVSDDQRLDELVAAIDARWLPAELASHGRGPGESLDVDRHGRQVFPRITTSCVAVQTDPLGVLPGGVVHVDETVRAFDGQTVDVGGKPVTIDLSAKVDDREKLPPEWKKKPEPAAVAVEDAAAEARRR